MKLKLPLLLLLVILGITTRSQTVTINVNPGASPNTAIGTANYHASESIYTDSEIGASNFITGATAIQKINFSINTVGVNTSISNYKIYLKNISSSITTLTTGTYSTAGYTLVYNGTFVANTTGFIGVTLSTTFTRTAGNNLQMLIERTDNISHSGYNVDASVGNSDDINANSSRRYNGATAPAGGSTTLTASTFRPMIQLIHDCTGAVGGTSSGTATFCVSGTPTITATGYSIGNGSGYQWQYSNDNFVSDINNFIGQTNPAALTTGVVSSTTSYRLRVTCSAGVGTDFSTISTVTILPTHNITASAGAGGSITPNGVTAVCQGSSQAYSISATSCYILSDVIVDGVSQGPVVNYTFTNVTTTHTIHASFTLRTYNIVVDDLSNGSITPGTGAVNCSSSPQYTITPDPCYHITNVYVDGVPQGPISTYTFTNVTTAHTISAVFDQDPPLGLPGPLTGQTNVCPYIGTNTVLTYSVPQEQWVSSYQWTVPPTLTIVSGQGTNTLQVTIGAGFIANANKQLRVRALSPCGNSGLALFYLLAQSPGTPQPITPSTSNVCPSIGTNVPITYTIPKVTAATSYIWSSQLGTTSISHPNGLGVNDTTVTVTFTGGFSTSNISVQAVNDCGTSSARSYTITRSVPAVPGLIAGPTIACPYLAPNGIPAGYGITGVANATTYTWGVPMGSTGLTGQGGTDISFTYPAGFTSGSVTVSATNGCGTGGNRVLNINTLNPSTPTPLDVIQLQSCPDRIYSYTLSVMPPNAVSVLWIPPAGGNIISGQGTQSVSISYPNQTINGNISTTAINNCGSSSTRLTPVKLPVCPPEFSRSHYNDDGYAAINNREGLELFPNPSASSFRLRLLPGNNEPAQVSVMDLQGRVVAQYIVLPGKTASMGEQLKPGTYIVRWKHGTQKEQVKKIIKI